MPEIVKDLFEWARVWKLKYSDLPIRTTGQDGAKIWETLLEDGNKEYSLIVYEAQKLGQGGFGIVCGGKMRRDGQTEEVAVKIVHYESDADISKLVEREVNMWKGHTHPNILPFYGVSGSLGVNLVGLVSPYASEGDMAKYIKNTPNVNRLSLLIQVAKGLHYLHVESGKGIVHGDLKCSNVFIAGDGHAMIGDFGLATLDVKLVGDKVSITATLLRLLKTVAFAAPELLSDSAYQKVETPETHIQVQMLRSKTTMSDAYAFGGMVFEAYAAEQPWAEHAANMDLFALANKIACELRKGTRPRRDSTAPGAVQMTQELWDFCISCWTYDPEGRPKSSAILIELQSIPGDGVAQSQTAAEAS